MSALLRRVENLQKVLKKEHGQYDYKIATSAADRENIIDEYESNLNARSNLIIFNMYKRLKK